LRSYPFASRWHLPLSTSPRRISPCSTSPRRRSPPPPVCAASHLSLAYLASPSSCPGRPWMRHGRSSPTIHGGGPGRARRPASILRAPAPTGSPASSAPRCHQARHRPWRRPGRICVAPPASTVSRLILQRTAVILGPAREGRKRQGQVGDSGPHGGAEAGEAGIFCFLSAELL
jgi:hypothetical protein